MNELLKKIKSLLNQGFASQEEKNAIATAVSSLKDEDQKALAQHVEKLNDLPTESKSNDDAEVEKGIKALFDKHANRIEESLKSEVRSFLKEQSDSKEKGVGIYHPQIAEKRKQLSSEMREWTKSLLNSDVATLKEMTTDASGSPYAGYTVGQELSAEIRHLVTEYGVARREMTTLPLTKNSYKANDLTTDVTVYWVDQGSAIASTQVVIGQESLELQKLGAIVSLTSELLEDTEIDLIAFIASRVAEGFAKAEDLAFFKGDGTSTYGDFTGLLVATDGNTVTMAGTTFASIDADDLLDMVDATPAGALANSKYYMNRTILSLVRKLKDDNNQYIYQAPGQSQPATIWNYPVVTPEVMPTASETADDTAFVLFGDLRKACILGYKASGLQVSRFNSGVIRNVAGNADVNLITTDREAIRWTERVGYVRIVPKAVTRLKTANA